MKAVPVLDQYGYEIVTCLGGGMLTSVYSARSYETDQPCAVKLLRPEWADQPIAIKLLQREARACLAVKHPKLVRVLDTHVLKPPYFLVMEMLPGESLRRRLRRDYRLDVPTVLWIARQTAETLAALHGKRFIHGDVKPDNIRLTGDGNAVLLDLGFAHRPGENASLIEAGYMLGTVDYLAPELCGSDPRDDRHSDIYSLGTTIYEMLAGTLPFPAASTLETLRMHHSEQAPNIIEFRDDLPRGLGQLLERMMAVNPDERPKAGTLVYELIGYEIAALGRRHAA